MNLPRLRAPSEDGGVLAIPPLDAVGEVLASNDTKLAELPFDRASAVNEAVAESAAYLQESGHFVSDIASPRLIVAGHQPELFHPGVWLKNFALATLAREHHRTALNIVADTDTLKSPAIRIPQGVGESAANVRLSTLAFDAAAGEVPFEERTVRDPPTFEKFGWRVEDAAVSWPHEPMVAGFWPVVVRAATRRDNIGEAFSAARRAVERKWGVANLEVPTSRLARTAAFRSFVAGVLGRLPDFHAAYNACVAEYRRGHRIRSRNHPAPDLGRDGDWLEAPFWGWRSGADRRGRLFARRAGDSVELRVAGAPWTSVPTDHLADGLQPLEGQGYKLRPRALTLTMFVRLYLADLFVHGIGGGMYDELTDAIIGRFFRITPAFAVLTGTLRLPFDRYPSTDEQLRRVQRFARDLQWNPQRHLPLGHGCEATVARRYEWQTANPVAAVAKRQRFIKLRELNESLAPAVSPQRAAVRVEMAGMKNEVAANAILRRRDYSFVLFPESMLRGWLTSAAAPPTSPPHPSPP